MDNTIKSKQEFLFKVIGRYDSIINSTNAKCSIVLAFNSIILGAVLFRFDEIVNIYCNHPYFRGFSILILVLIVLLSSISIIFSFRVMNPFLKSGEETEAKYKSIIFFRSVSTFKPKEYIEKINSLTDMEILDDLSRQVKVLADGLTKKMNDMQKAVSIIYVILILIIGLIVLKGVSFYG